MANILRFYPCGTKAIIKNVNVNAMITAACLRFDHLTYELTYFTGEYKKEWFDEIEFEVENGTVKQIGFKK